MGSSISSCHNPRHWGQDFVGPGKLRHLPHATLPSTKVSVPPPSPLCSSAPGQNFLDTSLGSSPVA